jgi:hypothetical protein
MEYINREGSFRTRASGSQNTYSYEITECRHLINGNDVYKGWVGTREDSLAIEFTYDSFRHTVAHHNFRGDFAIIKQTVCAELSALCPYSPRAHHSNNVWSVPHEVLPASNDSIYLQELYAAIWKKEKIGTIPKLVLLPHPPLHDMHNTS